MKNGHFFVTFLLKVHALLVLTKIKFSKNFYESVVSDSKDYILER